MKNLSKLLAMFLVLTMCMSLFCISAFADEIKPSELPEDGDEEIIDVIEEKKTEAPEAEENKVEEPAAEENKVEEPAAENKVEEPKAENKVEEPKADENKVEEPKADENKVEESKADEPKVEEPKQASELEEDEKTEEKKAEEADPVEALLKKGGENSASNENTFNAAPILFAPVSWELGSDGIVSGVCADLKTFKDNGYLSLFYSGPTSGTCGVFDWCFSDPKNGGFYLGNSFLNSLKPGTYTFMFVSLTDSTASGAGTLTVTAPAISLWPLETPKHVLGSASSLSFVLTDAPGSLTGITSGLGYVMVGGVVLVEGRDYYLTNSGDTNNAILTLSPYFMNKLTSGATYTLKVTDGTDLATTTFQIVGVGTSTSSPRTGDESNIGLWAALLLLSGTAAVVVVPKLKKRGM